MVAGAIAAGTDLDDGVFVIGPELEDISSTVLRQQLAVGDWHALLEESLRARAAPQKSDEETKLQPLRESSHPGPWDQVTMVSVAWFRGELCAFFRGGSKGGTMRSFRRRPGGMARDFHVFGARFGSLWVV